MRVREIMEPVTSNWLRPEQTLYDAICTMRKTRWEEGSVNGMVVLEHGMQLSGIITIKDIVKAIIPSYLDDNIGGFTWDGMFEEQVEKVRELLVRDVMTSELITAKPDDMVIHCADQMLDNQVQRLPVVDDSGKVLGIIRLRDVYLAMTTIVCKVSE